MDFLLSLWLILFSQTIQTKIDKTTAYETVELAVKREFGEEADLALAIFKCESGLRSGAIGDHGLSIGVAQIHLPAHAKKVPAYDKRAWLKNFQNNLRLAKKIRDKSGFEAWTCFKNNGYLQFYKKGE